MPRRKFQGHLVALDAVPHDGVVYYNPPWRTREAPKAISKSSPPWCMSRAEPIPTGAGYADNAHTFRKVRCPKCGRRLQPETSDHEMGHGSDFWPYYPPHKVRKTKWHPTDSDGLVVEVRHTSGPGGSKRCAKRSGVRIRHPETGTVVTASEQRSLKENLEVARSRMAAKLTAPQKPPRVVLKRSGVARLQDKQHRSALKKSRRLTDEE